MVLVWSMPSATHTISGMIFAAPQNYPVLREHSLVELVSMNCINMKIKVKLYCSKPCKNWRVIYFRFSFLENPITAPSTLFFLTNFYISPNADAKNNYSEGLITCSIPRNHLFPLCEFKIQVWRPLYQSFASVRGAREWKAWFAQEHLKHPARLIFSSCMRAFLGKSMYNIVAF